jgi:hypothetical protein
MKNGWTRSLPRTKPGAKDTGQLFSAIAMTFLREVETIRTIHPSSPLVGRTHQIAVG